MPAGYVYVLVNSSMPGLVKVGKTTKDPIERAGELSGVTGVATPFVLVFKQFCNDCNAAELQIHRALEVRGHRISSGREFFRAEANDVIRLVIETANTLGRSTTSNFRDADTDILSPELSDEFTLASSASYPPWRSLLLEADDLRYGVKDQIEDPTRALSLYKDAIRLGALVGYERVGSMYQYGQGTSQNRSKSSNSNLILNEPTCGAEAWQPQHRGTRLPR